MFPVLHPVLQSSHVVVGLHKRSPEDELLTPLASGLGGARGPDTSSRVRTVVGGTVPESWPRDGYPLRSGDVPKLPSNKTGATDLNPAH